MRVFAPVAFPYNGANYHYGWHDFTQALADTLIAAGYVVREEPNASKSTPAAVTWGGIQSASIASSSDLIPDAPGPLNFSIIANAGVSQLTASVLVALDAATAAGSAQNWGYAGTISLKAAGSGNLNIALKYRAYKIVGLAIVGGTYSATVGAGTNINSNSVTNPTITGIPATGPIPLAKCAIPIINPPTGTMGNNGALVLGANMPVSYLDAFMVLAAGDIFSGSAAGVYYCKFTGGSVVNCTIYQDQLTFVNGVAVIPTVPTPWTGKTGPGAGHPTANTVSDTVHASITLPGGSLGNNGTLFASAGVMFNGSGNSVSMLLAGTAWKSDPTSSASAVELQVSLRNRGTQQAQIASATTDQSDTAAGGAHVAYAMDLSIDEPFLFRSYVGTATSGWAIYDWLELWATQA